MEISHKARVALRLVWVAALVGLAAQAAHVGLGVGGPALDGFFNDWVFGGVWVAGAGVLIARLVLVREERAPWLVLAIGIALTTAGGIYYILVLAEQPSPPLLSIVDIPWLMGYPAFYVALIMLVRARVHQFEASLWLDGLIGGLAVTAIGAALVFEPLLESAGGTVAAASFAYHLGDTLLIAFVVGVFALTAWRPGRTWLLLGAGFATSAVADSVYLYWIATGTSLPEATIVDSLFLASMLMVAYAAWQPAHQLAVVRREGLRVLVIPSLFALTALAVLLLHGSEPLSPVAAGLAAATLVVVIARMALSFKENLRLLSAASLQALTDPLTGLNNRRKLIVDLDDELRSASREAPRILVLFDLDGFKLYNDSYGHPAGDALLARLGRDLATAVSPHGNAYRLGGDEFCALIRTRVEESEVVVAAAAAALSERGGSFDVSSSCGAVILPHEADDPTKALRIADQRLYGQKNGRGSSPRRQVRDVLMRVLREREPTLHEHLYDVSWLARAVGGRLTLSPEELDELKLAAELRDVGKLALPDEILRKAGASNEEDASFMRRHTTIGEEIISAAPTLLPVAKLVRFSHERYDGKGYPDGLAGEEIPLGARIIAVCDAFHAMTSDLPHQAAVSAEKALAELRRRARTEFDPVVVEAFSEELDAPSPARVDAGQGAGADDPLTLALQATGLGPYGAGPALRSRRSAPRA